MTQSRPAPDFGGLFSALLGAQSAEMIRSRQLAQTFRDNPEIIEESIKATWELVQADLDAGRNGIADVDQVAMHAATSEHMSSTHLAIVAGVAIVELAKMTRDLTAIIEGHSKGIGFTAPELIAEKQEVLIEALRSRLTERAS